MRNAIRLLVIAAIVGGAALGLPLLLGIWAPDVFTRERHILASERLPSGETFRVVQYWGVGSYTTELVCRSPGGQGVTHILDGDDRKVWRASLRIDVKSRKATVRWDDGRMKTADW